MKIPPPSKAQKDLTYHLARAMQAACKLGRDALGNQLEEIWATQHNADTAARRARRELAQ